MIVVLPFPSTVRKCVGKSFYTTNIPTSLYLWKKFELKANNTTQKQCFGQPVDTVAWA